MAPDSAPRQTWQLPTFLLGAVALGVALWAYPPRPARPADQFARDLADLKSALAKKPNDTQSLAPLAVAIQAKAAEFPEYASQAHYLAGSAYDRLADQTPGDAKAWQRAAAEFAQVDAEQLPPAEQPAFEYRHAKSLAATGSGDPKAVAGALLLAPAGEDDPERRRLLAEALLRTDSPNLAQIKQELSAYLQSATKLPTAAKSRLKEKLAAVHMALNEPDAARQWLKDLSADAPPDVKALAETRLGELAASEGRSADAARHFEQALIGDALPAAERPLAQYRAGMAWLKQDDATKAKAFLDAAASAGGPAAQAARVRLAELAMKLDAKGGRAVAADYLKSAVAGLKPGESFDNPLVSTEELRGVFEQAVRLTINADPESAAKAAESYAAVAAPGRAAEAKADALTAWAQVLATSQTTAADATAKFRTAAAEYTQLAKTFPTAAGQADFMRKASQALRRAGDDEAAVKVIQGVEKLAGVPDDVLTAAWVERGEALVAVNDFKAGTKALRDAVEKASPAVAAQARVKLATAYSDQAKQLLKDSAGKVTDAVRAEAVGLTKLGADLLDEVGKQPVETALGKDAQQTALFELGKVRLAQGDLAQAEEKFRKLMTAYPAGTMADQARLYLGCTLLQLGRGDNANDKPPANADAMLAEAAKLFEQLGSSPNAFLRKQADIRLANTLYLLKRFDELPALGDKLAAKYAGTVEELIVLSLQYSAERVTDKPQQAAKTFAKADAAYAKLPDAAFSGQGAEYTREFWVRWLGQLKGGK